ncbi:hypothetical protein AY600_13610 [Phormidium willei BDU 130791]|nr:hypothetical protein AY600_13610 [Phormidium willei BDU 130791]
MKTALRLAAVSTLALSSFGATITPQSANAVTFGERAVEQQNFVAVAAPVGETGRHQLLVIEQQSNARPCWGETGNRVNPLLLNFDFTGICGRFTDSNGYSLRTGGQDLGIQYSLRTVRRGNDVVLQGVPFRPNQPTLELGRAPYANDFVRIDLNDGWEFSKRTYQGRTLGHVYLSNPASLSALASQSPPVATNPSPPSTPVEEEPSQAEDWREKIELTAQQQEEIAEIRQAYLAENGRLQGRLDAARQELQEMMIGEASIRQIRRQRGQVERLRNEMSDTRFSTMMAIREVMSLEQRMAFVEVMDLTGSLDADTLLTTLLR